MRSGDNGCSRFLTGRKRERKPACSKGEDKPSAFTRQGIVGGGPPWPPQRAFFNTGVATEGHPYSYSVEPLAAVERAFQMKGRVAQVWPRCCGRNPKRTIRPLPTLISASAIWPRSL